MPTSRSYRDSCGIARALDVVGERWALLVVRELILEPKRFSELRHALPNASSNLLADRLRELEQHRVIQRREPVSLGYELTEWGRQLEPIIVALGDWGIDAPHPAEPSSLSATSVLIFLRGGAPPDPATPPFVGRLDLDGSVWTVAVESGELQVRRGEPAAADFSLRTDPKSLSGLLADPATLDTVLAEEGVALVGDRQALERLLRVVTDSRSGPD
jgi:DNA-binding HxlR family transcriptional regulator